MSFTKLAVLIAVARFALAQDNVFPKVPLAQKRFTYPDLPFQVDTDTGLVRGKQYGYNICTKETEGPDSKCQTGFLNSLQDFCLWGPPEPGSTVGNTEGEAVAWCTLPGRGSRIIPAGALTGVQFMRTPDYVQVSGFIDQTKVNIQAGDGGGEMDPHGADLRGNPLGGLLFSNAFPSNNGNLDTYQQVVEWHNFIGNNYFCFKACDPAGPNAAHFCEHIFDRIGCDYNAPARVTDGVFEECLGENQDFPGVWTDAAGVHTFTQPEGEINTFYPVRMPASSECVPHQSAALYGVAGPPSGHSAIPTPGSVSHSASASGSHTASATATDSASASVTAAPSSSKSRAITSASRSQGSPAAAQTSDGADDKKDDGNGASSLVVSSVALVGAVLVGTVLAL